MSVSDASVRLAALLQPEAAQAAEVLQSWQKIAADNGAAVHTTQRMRLPQ